MPEAVRGNQWTEALTRRTAMPEAELASKLAELNSRIRTGLPQDLINSLQVRDLAEQLVRIWKDSPAPNSDAAFRVTGRLGQKQK